MVNWSFIDSHVYKGFGVADYKCYIGLPKLKMADLIWRMGKLKIHRKNKKDFKLTVSTTKRRSGILVHFDWFYKLSSAILDPPFWILNIRWQIRNQRSQDSLYISFRANRVIGLLLHFTLPLPSKSWSRIYSDVKLSKSSRKSGDFHKKDLDFNMTFKFVVKDKYNATNH